MKSLKDYIEIYNPAPLESSFPPGMFDTDESAGSGQAVEALRVIEKLILSGSKQNVLNSRYALLQTFTRQIEEESKTEPISKDLDLLKGFIRKYCVSLCPDWYSDFLKQLSDEESEVFFKNYLTAHESFGHPDGVADLLRTMLESIAHHPVQVKVKNLEKQNRKIPKDMLTLLGRQYSTLGENMVPGKRFNSRPGYYDINIGPVFIDTLELFQKTGWATDIYASKKLCRLAEFAEPFYLRTRIHFILAKKGFEIGKATLGVDRLGSVVEMA